MSRKFRQFGTQSSLFTDAAPTPTVLDEIDKAVTHIHNLREQHSAAARAYREQRQAFIDAERSALQELERAMRAAVLEQYQNECLYAEIRSVESPKIVDADKLMAWTQQPDRRTLVSVTEGQDGVRLKVNESRWRRLVAAGEEVPGVECVTEEKVVAGHLE